MDFFSTTIFEDWTDNTSSYLWLVILGGFVCFAMSWGIGANDVANAFSTSVGAKAITLKQAVIIAAIFEFVGAVGLGASVTSTIRKKITKFELFEGEEDVLMLGMFCSLCSAALWLFLATKYSFPVSTTHSIIGAIVGFSVAAKGLDSVDWEQILYIILFWIIAPFMAALSSMLLFGPLRLLILRKENSYQLALRYWPIFVFIVTFIMCIFLIIKGLKRFDFDYQTSMGLAMGITFGISIIVSIISYFAFIYSGAVSRMVDRAVAKQEGIKALKKAQEENLDNIEAIEMTTDEETAEYGPYSTTTHTLKQEDIIEKVNISKSVSTPHSTGSTAKSNKSFSRVKESMMKGVEVDIHDDMELLEMRIHQHSEKFDYRTEKSFAWLQVCTAALDIFAHGSNDVANAVAPFAAMVGLYSQGISSSKVPVPEWILIIGAVGMVLGLATYGYKIMKCLGVRMCMITNTRGYCIELSSAIIIIMCSVLGYPASTTHAQVGATIGVGLMEKARKNSTLKWKEVINWKLLAQVFLGWILTLVFTGVTCGAIFALLAYSPYAGDVTKNCYCDE
eukprot:344709_1